MGAWVWLVAMVGCRKEPTGSISPDELDLAELLGPGEVRAGVLSDEAPLFGGISAEARPGDVLLYNDRVRFVIQGARAGNFYLPEGGGVIDADIVRPEGQLGRDAVEEWGTMFGLGRIVIPEEVVVLDDGSDGGTARVRVSGYEGPLGLLEGALELPGFIPDLGLEMQVEYALPADSWLLEVTATATATTSPATLAVGDVLIGADEVLAPWVPGAGLADSSSAPRAWSGYVGDADDVAYVMAAEAQKELSVAGYELLTELTSMVVGFAPSVTLQPGESTTWTRYYGVGPDLATLSGAVLQARGEPSTEVTGQVTGPDGPVAGARVVIDVDGAPWTAARTGSDGTYRALVPDGAVTSALAVGRGTGMFLDLPEGAAPGSPYAADGVRQQGLLALSEGALPVPQAIGRGVSAAGQPGQHELGLPGTLTVKTDEGLPFSVKLALPGPDETDRARVPARPSGQLALGWARDGEITLTIEPGTYELLVHRGPAAEYHATTVTIAPGQDTLVETSLPAAFAHPGWLLGDPHSHASPSSDGGLAMEDRLIVSSASGIQVHFGTDHDHLADYRPLLAPLGLDGVLYSVVADEVSPPLRGHFNIYPVQPTPGQPDNGAWLWWTEIPASTEAMVDKLRERHGEDFILQSNHPTDSGMASSAGWSPGTVPKGGYWTDRLQAVEVLNSGDHQQFVEFWYDLVLRGQMVTPVGVSDSHSHTAGDVGFSATWLQVGSDVREVTDEGIADAIRTGRVQPARGPFLLADRAPNQTVSAGTTVHVRALSASYVKVDRLRLLRDGAEVEVVEGTEATFTLSAERDALFVIEAVGDSPMLPVSNLTPWAMLGPWRLDVEGNGWEPPLPPLQVN